MLNFSVERNTQMVRQSIWSLWRTHIDEVVLRNVKYYGMKTHLILPRMQRWSRNHRRLKNCLFHFLMLQRSPRNKTNHTKIYQRWRSSRNKTFLGTRCFPFSKNAKLCAKTMIKYSRKNHSTLGFLHLVEMFYGYGKNDL